MIADVWVVAMGNEDSDQGEAAMARLQRINPVLYSMVVAMVDAQAVH